MQRGKKPQIVRTKPKNSPHGQGLRAFFHVCTQQTSQSNDGLHSAWRMSAIRLQRAVLSQTVQLCRFTNQKFCVQSFYELFGWVVQWG